MRDVPTRDRILFASAELLRRQGYGGTGLKQVLGQAQAPFGSLYHFFPGGKEELAEETLRAGGRFFLALYEHVSAEAGGDLERIAHDFFHGAADTLAATDFHDACPIATVAGEIASTHDRLRQAAADAFESWLGALQRDCEAAGIAPDRARTLAVTFLALLEGAFLLSRSGRSLEPMYAGAAAAQTLVAAELTRST